MSHSPRLRADARFYLPFALLLGSCSLFESDSHRPQDAAAGAAPALAELQVSSTRTSPALVSFVLRDAEGDAADVSLAFVRPDGSEAPATIVGGEFTHPDTRLRAAAEAALERLEAPADGRVHYRLWDFAADLGEGVTRTALRATLASAAPFAGEPSVPADVDTTVGNEAPTLTVSADEIALASGGVVRLPLRVEDSRGDAVRIRIEYQLVDVAACSSFFPARDALLAADAEAPEFQLLTPTDAEEGPRELEYLWDTEYRGAAVPTSCDLFEDTRAVRLRFTAEEILSDPDDAPLTSSALVFEDGAWIDNSAPDASDGPGGDDGGDDGDGPGGDDPDDGGDDDGSDDDGDDDPWAPWMSQLVANHPWIVPFLEDPALREILLEASRFSPTSVAVADVDANGEVDIVRANTAADVVEIYLQTARGVVASEPLVLGGPGITDAPVSIAVAQLAGSRALDIVSGNLDGDDLTIFTQTEPRTFASDVTRLQARSELRPMRIRGLDVDRDGDVDLVTADELGVHTGLFLQVRPGVFEFVTAER